MRFGGRACPTVVAAACMIVGATTVIGCGRLGFDVASGNGDGGTSGDGGATGDGGANPNGLNLESTIEMIGGASLASAAGAVITFDRSQTVLDPSDYDGAVTFYFEIVAVDDDDTDQTVELVDAATLATVTTITVPHDSADSIRLRSAAFTPAAGAGAATYVVRLPATVGAFDVNVFDARLIVRQVGATKTRLYFPLTSFEQVVTGDVNGPNNGPTDGILSTTYTQDRPERYSIWQKATGRYATIAPGTPWTFDALIAANDLTHMAFASLFDRTTGTQIAATEVHTDGTSTAIERHTIDVADAAAGFTADDDVEVRMRGDNAASVIYLFKAGLWLRLEDLSAAEILLRVGGSVPLSPMTETTESARALLDATAFSNPVFAFEVVAASTTAAPCDAALLDDGTRDSNVDPVGVSGTTLPFHAKARQRVGPLTLPPADRYYTDMDVTNMPEMSSAAIAIDISR